RAVGRSPRAVDDGAHACPDRVAAAGQPVRAPAPAGTPPASTFGLPIDRWLELSVDARAEAIDWACALLAPLELAPELRVGPSAARPWERGRRACLRQRVGRAGLARLDAALAPLRRLGLAGDLSFDEVAAPPPPTAGPRRVGERFVLLWPGAEAALGPDDRPI